MIGGLDRGGRFCGAKAQSLSMQHLNVKVDDTIRAGSEFSELLQIIMIEKSAQSAHFVCLRVDSLWPSSLGTVF